MIFLYAFCFLCGIIGIYWASNESARFSVEKFNISLTEAKNVHRFFLIVFLIFYSCLLAFLGMGGYLLISQRKEKPLPPPAPQLYIKIDSTSKQQQVKEEQIRQKKIIEEHVKLLDKLQSTVIKEAISPKNYTSQRSTALIDNQVQYSDHVVTKKESEQQRNQTVIIKPIGIKRRVAKRAKVLPKTSTPSPSVRIKKKNTIRRHRTLPSPKKYPRAAEKKRQRIEREKQQRRLAEKKERQLKQERLRELKAEKKRQRIEREKQRRRSAEKKKTPCQKIKDSLDKTLLNDAIRTSSNNMIVLYNKQNVPCYISSKGIEDGYILYQIEEQDNSAICFYKEPIQR